MSKYKKAAFLIALLLVPAFIFLFLKGFTTNHFDLPYFNPVRDARGSYVMNESGDTLYQNIGISGFRKNGHLLTREDFRAKWVVLGLFPGQCEVPCKRVLSNLKRLNVITPSIPELIMVMATDSLPGLTEALANSDAKTWWIVAGSRSDLEGLGQAVNGVSVEAHTSGIGSGSELVLIDAAGFVRGRYNGMEPEEIDRLMAEIKILSYNKSLKE